MSTFDQSVDEARTFAGLDAEDRADATAARVDPDQAYERYAGPLSYTEFVAAYQREAELDRLGIRPVEIPEQYAEALGPARTASLRGQIEERLIGAADSPPSREELGAQARQYGALARAMDLETGKRVVELEDRRADLREELLDAAKDEIDPTGLREQMTVVRDELEQLSRHEGHPDRWLEENGQRFADALAARHQLRAERELAPATPTTGIEQARAVARDSTDSGIDLF